MTDNIKLDSFDIKKFNPEQDQYIQASAGTGKTFTIRKISAELVKRGIPLTDVLFVTYTDKAAGEMRARIREEMNECLAKADAQTRPLFERACQDVDKAVIGTIHSFCRKTLHDFAYEANVPFDMENADSQSAKVLIDKAIRDEWEEEICALEVKKSLPEDVEEIKDMLINSLKTYSPEKESVFPATSALEWIEHNPEAKKHWEVLKKYPSETFTGRNGERLFRNKTVESLMDAILSSKVTLVSGTKFGKSLESVSLKEPDSQKELVDALKFFYPQKIALFTESEQKRLLFLSSKTKILYERWQQEKKHHKEQTFEDMISAVREAVCPGGKTPEKPTFLCQKIRDTYQIAIIDEFQDTNEFQWNIFDTAFLKSDKNHLIVVGDPKQSIYSFQGADLQVYRRARGCIGHGSELKTNFRSSISMIKACNLIFTVGDEFSNPFLPKGDFEKSNVPTEAKNQRQNALLNGVETPPIWVSPIVPSKGYARFAVQKIIDCCKVTGDKTALQIFERGMSEPRNVNYSDFAVLGRTRSEMDDIKKCLTDVGIPFVLYKDASLFDSRECSEWIAVLRMLAAPDLAGYNRKLVNSVFVTDFFGKDLRTLDDDPQKNADENVRMMIESWRQLASQKCWTELQEQIYEDTQVEKFLSTPSTLQDLLKLRQIGNYIFGYLYEKKATLQQAIKHLETLSKDSKKASDEESNIVAKGTDFKAVKLMTIHASKGLEFPVVISCGGDKGVNKKAAGPYVFSQDVESTDGGEDILQKKYFGYDANSKKMRQCEEIEEWHRLLYVDYTRASSLLILPQYDSWFECEKEERKDKNGKTYKVDVKETHYNLEMNKLKLDDNGCEIIDENNSWSYLAYSHREICKDEVQAKFAKLCDWDGAWDVETLKDAVSKQLAFFNKDEQLDSTELPSAETIGQVCKSIKESTLYQHSYSSIGNKASSVDIQSFDGELQNKAGEEPEEELDSNESVIFDDYPRGSLFGDALHSIFEHLDFKRIGNLTLEDAENDLELQGLIENSFLSQGLPIGKHPDWMNRTVGIVWNTMNAVLPEIRGTEKTGTLFSLKKLDASERLAEMEFRLKANKDMDEEFLKTFCKGFMDLVFVQKDGDKEYYSVLDWKSNVLEKYDSQASFEAVKEHYSIQMILYSYCLIQWLCSIWSKEPKDVFEEHFGGIYYVFARGCKQGDNSGIYAHTWNSFEKLQEDYEKVKNLMYVSRSTRRKK